MAISFNPNQKRRKRDGWGNRALRGTLSLPVLKDGVSRARLMNPLTAFPWFVFLLVCGLLDAPSRAMEPAKDHVASETPPRLAPDPDPMNRWLDEVRAQRQAWQERRRVTKEAIDARRRWIDPWGAAQHQAREKETQRRREAFHDQIARERQAFREQGPWFVPPVPGEEPEAQANTLDFPAYPPLPGWDNRWYYRGY